jgi:2-polyprenyl-3-methyl-5-hydroxy-6-metoxy-1,4-benzoquinol methylase
MDWRSDAAKNVALWTQSNAEYTDANAAVNWALEDISWGIWGIDESELNVIGDVTGLDVVELGCGTAYFSAWLAKRGARPVGVDITPAQLATARQRMAETGIEFPLVEADAAETLWSPSTARRSGSIRTAGSRKQRGCCATAADSSSYATRRS